MSAYLEACLSALQNSDDKRLAGCNFYASTGGAVGSIFMAYLETIEFAANDEWYLMCPSVDICWFGIEDVGRLSAVLEILNSVPRGDGDE